MKKKNVFVFLTWIFALIVLSSSECVEQPEEVVYVCVEKGSQVGSHFNPFHEDSFEVGTDYFITFQNAKTKNVVVYETRSGQEFYQYQVGKRYRMRRLYNDKSK